MKRTIIFYRTKDNYCQIEEFFDSLEDKVVSKILAILKYVEELDFIPIKYFKKLTNTDLYEVRIMVGNNIYRLLCFFHKNSLIVLTNGFMKKTQKTPPNEIKKAENYRSDYLRRNT